MNVKPNFLQIERFSTVFEENEFFQQYFNSALSNYLEANFIYLKYSPTIEEFKIIEKIHQDYHSEFNLPYLNFYWPANQGVHTEVLDYFDQQSYQIGMNSLYYLPYKEKVSINNPNISILEVTDQKNLKYFIELNQKENLKINYLSKEKTKANYLYMYKQENVHFYLAYIDKRVVGSMILTTSNNFIEIKELLTNQSDRKKGVARSFIHFASRQAQKMNKKLIVVTDTEDTPRKMYEKMGFIFLETQINARKPIE